MISQAMNNRFCRWSIAAALAATFGVVSLASAQSASKAARETPIVRVFKQCSDAVVNISTTRIVKRSSPFYRDEFFEFFNTPSPFGQQRLTSLGSGFVIHSAGYIVTNAHVVERAEEAQITFADQTNLKATRIYSDPQRDLVVLKVTPPAGKTLKAIHFGRGDDLMIGETVIAIGNPLGYHHSLTTGVISAINRELPMGNDRTYRNLVQTDASINPGNSGGPLLNINGDLIGINTAIRSDAQNIGFAVNIDVLKTLLPKLLDAETQRRINLGFEVTPVVDRNTDQEFVRVSSVRDGSPAAQAGIQAGDLIIACEGADLVDPVDFYIRMMEHAENQNLPMTLERNGQRVQVSLPFVPKPKPNGVQLGEVRLGVALQPLSLRQANELGIEQTVLQVTHVVNDSPAAQAGIQPDDILLQLDKTVLTSIDQLGQILDPMRSGDQVFVRILRPSSHGGGRLIREFEGTIRLK